MINNSKQNWSVGQTVRVGFMSLNVRKAIPTPDDGAPDAYILSNQSGDQLYAFVPHNGCRRITQDEASNMIHQANSHAKAVTEAAIAKAKTAAQIDAIFA